jgi:hypothetical protein
MRTATTWMVGAVVSCRTSPRDVSLAARVVIPSVRGNVGIYVCSGSEVPDYGVQHQRTCPMLFELYFAD